MPISVADARFCEDCETIFDLSESRRNNKCPTCGSESTWPLSSWLNPHLVRFEITPAGEAELEAYKESTQRM